MAIRAIDIDVTYGYGRHSTDKQGDYSVAYQREAILQYCRQHNLTLSKFFYDGARTGTNLNRNGIQDLIRAAKGREFSTLIIYDISRGSRDIGDWFTLRSLMTKLGIKLISVKQHLGDITNPSDFIKEAIEVSFAQYEVLQARSKSMAGSKERASEAKFMGGTPPLGYDIVDDYYVINELEASWVRLIHSMYVLGATYKEIIGMIPDARSKLGNPLDIHSIHAILKNPKYDGTYSWNEYEHKMLGVWAGRTPKEESEITRIEDGIPAIVTQEIKREVMKRMEDRKYGGRNSAKREYLLSGLIECELCGSSYHGRTTKNKKGYESVSYVCGNKYNYRRNHSKKCTTNNVNAAGIETFVVAQLKRYLKSSAPEEIACEIASQVNNASADLIKEKSELAKTNAQLQNGTKAILDGMDYPELRHEMDRLRVRKSELEDIIARAQSERRRVSTSDVVKLFEYSAKQIEAGNISEVLRYHVTKIIAHADGSCTVNMGVCINGCGGRI